MILGANIRALGSHLAGWRHPKAWPRTVMNLQNYIEMAKMVEAAKLHFVFLADGNGIRGMDQPKLFAATAPSDRPAVFEPVTLLSVIATVTKHVGLVATATTTYEEPFLVARKFASLDHISGGRAAWNLVTTSNAEDSLNFNRTDHMARDERYERATEFAADRARAVGQLGRRRLSGRQGDRTVPQARSGSRARITRESTSPSAGRSMSLAPRRAIL